MTPSQDIPPSTYDQQWPNPLSLDWN
jgi:hypothetical protein